MANYYSLLGVDKNATADEIKKAYRKLAHEHHPDKNHGDKASEAKFKEINAAYEVLGNAQKRSQYDQFGSSGSNPFGGSAGAGGGFQDFGQGNFNFGNMDFGGVEEMFETFFGGNPFGGSAGGFGQGQANRTRKKGVDLEVELNVTLQEAAKGVAKVFKHKHKVNCNACKGKGYEVGSSRKQCPTCHGRKTVYQRVQTIFGTVQQEIVCPTCNGNGETFDKVCQICHGKGFEETVEEINLDVPVGISSGQRLKVPNKGEAGYHGSDPGDLYVLINVKEDKKLKREGMDIYSSVEINYIDLLLGTNAKIETVWGVVEIKIPALTDPSKELRLRDHGMPKLSNSNVKGDHHLKIKIQMPTSLSKAQKELLESVRQENK